MERLLDRFFHYVSFDTQSRPNARLAPSTEGQTMLAESLARELIEMGLSDVELSPYGCLTATLPSNVGWSVPTIGFLAHMDTSPDVSGKGVRPQIVDNYRGGDIALGIGDEVLSPVMFPVLHQLHGQTLITTDGKTLLGADDKAGIAEILTAIARLKGSDRPHGDVRIAFTPDEEVGKSMKHFDIQQLGAQWGYTVDGGGVGELECENFNAAQATVKIVGNGVHIGRAKGVMISALTLAARFQQMLPADETPENTEGYEGFYHLNAIRGSVDYAEMSYSIRDFERDGFEKRKRTMIEAAKAVGEGLHRDCHIEVTIKDLYYNMREEVAKHPHVVEIAHQAMLDNGIEPQIVPIRGGTDGAILSQRGLPCPNIFTGGYNSHSKHEFITVEGMEKATSVIMRIAEITAERAR
ncbi:peptidase T [Leminorella grimontii]|uniref:Peptidase T n=1 Tax=Leminorella grimontii TaxID=82981 RepID=A0AAV5MXD4_9GAMM|nr:peptidase T [Leminorella grimontii]KFC96318.1 tripeptide aminopeptidase [Leminorella grimontii ATCC 33999 = DSM 5078]GKX54491.1 peptidase T [Leminorella grimontii]VFS59115.1 Peptidase T [Leminorella grimontii]